MSWSCRDAPPMQIFSWILCRWRSSPWSFLVDELILPWCSADADLLLDPPMLMFQTSLPPSVDVEALLDPLPIKFHSNWTSVSKHNQTEPTLDGNNSRLQREEFEITRNSTTWFCRRRRSRSRFSDDVEDLLDLLCHRGWSPVRPSSMTPATSDDEEDLLTHRLCRSLLDPVSAWMIGCPSVFADVSHLRRVHLVFRLPRYLQLSF